jgi:hypothetical protein
LTGFPAQSIRAILTVLREEIMPRLERDAPGQPDSGTLEADPLRSQITLVFDRESYSSASPK